MNNDARFFFYLSGFIGFVVFFLMGIIISQDFIVALVQSTFGCLFFSLCGRFLLSFILNGIIVESSQSHNKKDFPVTLSKQNENDPAQLAAAMNEASTNSKHLVEAQV
ncbi:MAG: hypothetical protein HN548_03185 [Opitutae bacterium]|jgi:hypothetical protein|nr:hypothetical protein [Opitutae bacterium]MBT5717148.1 hypothetical protein [Opitutae bacterium]